MNKINVIEKFALFNDFWAPKIVGELNNQHIKLARVKGEFVWHQHEHEDELFFVVKGRLKIEFREKVVELNEGEMLIVPRGTEHKPVAENEAWVMLFEPVNTLNTGNIIDNMTKEVLESI